VLAWRKAVGDAVLRRQERLRYGDPRGYAPLRAALQGYLWRARGLRCEPDQIIVVSGSQQGLDLCARLLLDPGDHVLMENPGYALARQVFLATGAAVTAVSVAGGAAGLHDAVAPVSARQRALGRATPGVAGLGTA
jgi:GntR family transcriptional regulator/MocR family aminotransferase